MKVLTPKPLVFVILSLFSVTLLVHGSTFNERKTYIVYMGDLAGDGNPVVEDHHNLLLKAMGNENEAREAKIHSYGKSFNGFVAKLLPHEVGSLSNEESVVSVFENVRLELHTTRSWDFLGLPPQETKKTPLVMKSDIIVGVLDSGIDVSSPSFNDAGYGPVPARWKGKCVATGKFIGCNKKVIGATFFDLGVRDVTVKDDKSPFDTLGHGTQTASIIAGVPVKGASLYGIANGTARGGVSSARIAVYKVCWAEDGCTAMAILAAFDSAIADGVDVISIAAGLPTREYWDDPIAIGSFHAMKKGILTSAPAGNGGPILFSVINVAPWVLTVAANSIDREFRTGIKLGNGYQTYGISINTYAPKNKMYSLTSGTLAANVTGDSISDASLCNYGTLGMDKVKGKIVYCRRSFEQDKTIKELGGAGVVMTLDHPTDDASSISLPGTFVLKPDGNKIEQYINTTKNPQAVIEKTITVKMAAPFVALTSSRGPQAPIISPNILKPDISAPGLNILVATSKGATGTDSVNDDKHALYSIASGTSIASPHAIAAAAYVKSHHPDWSPAAIKSALMTTATPMKTKGEDTELGYGSGQINPTNAVNPGLVYDISLNSYIDFLCKEGYNTTLIAMLDGAKNKYKCSNYKTAKGTDGLNYPTMHLQLNHTEHRVSAVFYRTVTNVGYGNSIYKATVTSPKGIYINITPNVLKFTRPHEKLSFEVVVKGDITKKGTQIISALLEWKDAKHIVRSPIVIVRPEKVWYEYVPDTP